MDETKNGKGNRITVSYVQWAVGTIHSSFFISISLENTKFSLYRNGSVASGKRGQAYSQVSFTAGHSWIRMVRRHMDSHTQLVHQR